MEEEGKLIHTGKKWKDESFHQTYQQADIIRQKLLNIWTENTAHTGMQVKVKFLPSKNKFVVKTRRHPDFDSKKETKGSKKNGKSKRRNKKNTDRTMFDATASI